MLSPLSFSPSFFPLFDLVTGNQILLENLPLSFMIFPAINLNGSFGISQLITFDDEGIPIGSLNFPAKTPLFTVFRSFCVSLTFQKPCKYQHFWSSETCVKTAYIPHNYQYTFFKGDVNVSPIIFHNIQVYL